MKSLTSNLVQLTCASLHYGLPVEEDVPLGEPFLRLCATKMIITWSKLLVQKKIQMMLAIFSSDLSIIVKIY